MDDRVVRRRVLKWEITGIFFLLVVGSLLHFTYEWSGSSPLVGLFSAVNESVWEHLKLGFWSAVIFSFIEYWFIRNEINNFFIAKAVGILVMQLFIVIFFYTYTALVGTEILALDILSYVIGSILCQLLSYRILMKEDFGRTIAGIGLGLIVLHGVALMVFTFYPPKLPIFQDQNTKTYGITWNIDESQEKGGTVLLKTSIL